MKFLVIGSGGREHALAKTIALSPKTTHVFVAPGNAGTAFENKVSNIEISDIPSLIEFAKINQITFTVVGPEVPLAEGIVNQFRANDLKIWGPTQYCAQLESSKAFAKQFMKKYNIPTSNYEVFDSVEPAKQYLKTQKTPIVIKADGLAAGKGVLVAHDLKEALNFIDDIFEKNKFGRAGNKVIIEEFLNGVEASFIVMIDGKNILPLATSQDHKRLLNNDKGPNTGGMGAYSPAPIISPKIHEQVINEIIQPVIDGMQNEGHTYTGFLYAGLMIGSDGIAKTLEFNCRLGDPETQPILSRLETDLVDLIDAGLSQNLNKITPKWQEKFAVGVVVAAEGYPDSPRKNDIITGLDHVAIKDDIQIFHAATKLMGNTIYTNGGRVLCVVALDQDLKKAQKKAYNAIKTIHFTGMQYREDISDKAFIF